MPGVQKHIVAFLCFAGVAGIAAHSEGGPWADPSGAAASFTYSNGRDLNGFFGEPVVSGDTLFFPQFHFAVSAADDADAGVSDRVSFDIVPNPGLTFGSVRVAAVGYYEISGAGEVGVDVDTSPLLRENGGSGRAFAEVMLTEPAFPQSSGSSGWRGLSILDLSFEDPPLHDNLHFEFYAGIFANTASGGTAQIDMQLLGGLIFTFIPEPATMSMLLLAAACTILRRWH